MLPATLPQQESGLIGWVLQVIDRLGEIGVGALVALESVIPPIPSELVLPAAGALVYFDELSAVLTVLCATLGSLLGALILYGAGRAYGEDRTRQLLLKVPLVEPDDVDRADDWFQRRGEAAVLVGRVIPGVRSLVSLPAGAARMPVAKFLLLTAIGSLVWNVVLIGAGWVLGTQYHLVEEHVDLFNALVYVALAAGVGWFVVRRRLHRRRRAAGRDSPSADR